MANGRNKSKGKTKANPNWQPFQRKRHGVRLNVAASPLLDRCLRRQGRVFIRIAKDWQHIAGEAHEWTHPLSVKGRQGEGVLTIATNSAHALILHMHIPDIIARSNQRLGYTAISRIIIDQANYP
ncbi:MAG: DUF721 domain-containing protein [Proteobacteria bacterium]|nr:DUF721 domain-containing protein [Pseudomonadota bacterium]